MRTTHRIRRTGGELEAPAHSTRGAGDRRAHGDGRNTRRIVFETHAGQKVFSRIVGGADALDTVATWSSADSEFVPRSLMTRKAETVSLIGAGLSGPLLALGLVKRGFRVEIYERRPDMRRSRISAGRSINLALSTRGIHALTEAQLWNDMREFSIPMKGRMMHSVASELTFQPYGKNDAEVIHSISRSALNVALMNAAEAQGVQIHFEQRCTGLELKTGILQMRDEWTGTVRGLKSNVVIGCDGSASAIRNDMLKLSRFNFSQQYLDYGYKELTIAAGPDGKHVLEPNALHIWPRGNYMLIALPNR